MYDIIELNNKLVNELKEIAKKLNVPKFEKLKKQDLIYQILDHQAINPLPKEEKPEPKPKAADPVEDENKSKRKRTRVSRVEKVSSSRNYTKKDKKSEAQPAPEPSPKAPEPFRSEERRVGKECRSRWSTEH